MTTGPRVLRADVKPSAYPTLARRDRQALYTLLDDLHDAVEELRRDHQAASRERRAAGRDRHHSLGDRTDSGQDRHDARADRHQAAIDREQVDPRDLPIPPPATDTAPQPPDPTGSRQALAIATSRQRIAETRNYLSSIGRDRTAPPAPLDPPDPPETGA